MYIDGFNFYYGSLKGTPYKWLDPYALACALMPSDRITAVHYFTARVKPTPRNPSVHQRQGIYLRALATLPNVHVREGFFLLKTSRQPKVQPLNPANPKIPNPANTTVEIWLNEEKGSDVNLATQLLVGRVRRQLRPRGRDQQRLGPGMADPHGAQKFKKNVGIYKPERPAGYPSTIARPDSKELQKNARWFRHIEERHLIASQLPPTLTDATGTITKPPTW